MYEINWVAIVVATIVMQALGAFWYSPKGFGDKWLKLMGVDPNDKEKMEKMKKEGNKSMKIALVASLLTAFTLEMFISMMGVVGVWGGVKVAFWAWLGFVATSTLSDVLWANKKVELYKLYNGYMLLAFVLMGAVIGFLG